jgi:hypothetical protein
LVATMIEFFWETDIGDNLRLTDFSLSNRSPALYLIR